MDGRPVPTPPTACKHTVSGSVSLPSPGCFSPFPHGTVRYRSRPVGCLGRWSARLPTGLHVSRGTRDGCLRDRNQWYGTLTRCGGPFQALPAGPRTECWESSPSGRSHNPPDATPACLARRGFGQQPGSLATTSGRLLLPAATEMFQFAAFPPAHEGAGPLAAPEGVAPFGDGRITAWVPLPDPIAADRRPSSAGRAEASSNRATCLAWSQDHSAPALARQTRRTACSVGPSLIRKSTNATEKNVCSFQYPHGQVRLSDAHSPLTGDAWPRGHTTGVQMLWGRSSSGRGLPNRMRPSDCGEVNSLERR